MTLLVVDGLLDQWQDDPVYSPVLERARTALNDANPFEWLMAYTELPEGLQTSIDKADLVMGDPATTDQEPFNHGTTIAN